MGRRRSEWHVEPGTQMVMWDSSEVGSGGTNLFDLSWLPFHWLLHTKFRKKPSEREWVTGKFLYFPLSYIANVGIPSLLHNFDGRTVSINDFLCYI